ncbi:MAG: hypothetical protein QJR01_04475 [Kyrpidia sp.]|nr:hypothetical protein [Kyrpidia sp.]
MFHYTVTTDKSVDESVKALEEALKERRLEARAGEDGLYPVQIRHLCHWHPKGQDNRSCSF